MENTSRQCEHQTPQSRFGKQSKSPASQLERMMLYRKLFKHDFRHEKLQFASLLHFEQTDQQIQSASWLRHKNRCIPQWRGRVEYDTEAGKSEVMVGLILQQQKVNSEHIQPHFGTGAAKEKERLSAHWHSQAHKFLFVPRFDLDGKRLTKTLLFLLCPHKPKPTRYTTLGHIVLHQLMSSLQGACGHP